MKGFAIGAATAIVVAFPAAALVALSYGFPIPFADHRIRGTEAVLHTIFAVVFHGVIGGGFLFLFLVGGLAGAIASRINSPSSVTLTRRSLIAGAAVSVAGVLFLTFLEKIIGPW